MSKVVTLDRPKQGFWARLKRDFKKNYQLYLLVLPVLLYYIIFCYKPMYGALIAFQDYNPLNPGVLNNEWVGFKNFIDFFQGKYFWRLIKNTVTISLSSIIFGFPIPIIFALLLNEITHKKFVKVIQTMSYMPHFISIVVVCSMIMSFTNSGGFINEIAQFFGYSGKPMLSNSGLFVPIYVISAIWQGMGWDSILYIAALAGINQELYEAAEIDGAGRFQQLCISRCPALHPQSSLCSSCVWAA